MRALLIAAALLAASTAEAQRLDTLRMSCGQTRAVVAQQGAVILGTGPNIYDRYVANSNFCAFGETTRPGWVQTRDNANCVAGGLCYTPDRRPLFDD
ncbi:MAG: hypothetical protein ABWZ80_07820 [Beijerinckiaceae bacterium]